MDGVVREVNVRVLGKELELLSVNGGNRGLGDKGQEMSIHFFASNLDIYSVYIEITQVSKDQEVSIYSVVRSRGMGYD